MSITIVAVEDGEFYMGADTSGSTVNVTLRRDNMDGSIEYVTCEGILIFEEDELLADGDSIFDEWKGYAEANEEGFIYEKIEG